MASLRPRNRHFDHLDRPLRQNSSSFFNGRDALLLPLRPFVCQEAQYAACSRGRRSLIMSTMWENKSRGAVTSGP